MLTKDLPGTPLKSKDLENVLTLKYKPNLKYAWDNGVAIGKYLEELKNGKIIAKKCNKCQRIMIPPRMFCELCFRSTDDWVYVKDTGIINTFSISYVHWDASRIKEGEQPYLPAVIEIDNASKGMGILHLLGEVIPNEVKIGMRVKAVWKPVEERTGAITDIKYFKPY